MSRRTLGELLRFGVVGGTCFVAGVVSIVCFTEVVGLHYLLSTAVSIVLVNVLGWLLNRVWTFRSRSAKVVAEAGRYFTANLAGAGAALAGMALLVSGAGLDYRLASLLVALGMMPLNFLMHRHWSFRRTHVASEPRS